MISFEVVSALRTSPSRVYVALAYLFVRGAKPSIGKAIAQTRYEGAMYTASIMHDFGDLGGNKVRPTREPPL